MTVEPGEPGKARQAPVHQGSLTHQSPSEIKHLSFSLCQETSQLPGEFQDQLLLPARPDVTMETAVNRSTASLGHSTSFTVCVEAKAFGLGGLACKAGPFLSKHCLFRPPNEICASNRTSKFSWILFFYLL